MKISKFYGFSYVSSRWKYLYLDKERKQLKNLYAFLTECFDEEQYSRHLRKSKIYVTKV